MHPDRCVLVLLVALALFGCHDTSATAGEGPASSEGGTTIAGTTAGVAGSSDGGVDTTATGGDPPRFDLASADVGPHVDPTPVCTVDDDDMSAPGSCMDQAPAGSFTATLEWSWSGEGLDVQSIATPLVANTNDDDGNGVIDLCDIPDVIVVAYPAGSVSSTQAFFAASGNIYALDGATGSLLWQAGPVTAWAQPALGDIDGDGLVEIVAPSTILGPLAAWNHDGSPLAGFADPFVLTGDPLQLGAQFASGVAIADLQHDGSPEIMIGRWIHDATGALVATVDDVAREWTTPALVDLDEDGVVEVITGQSVHRYLGPDMLEPVFSTGLPDGHPHVADLDGDGAPELVISHPGGVSVFAQDGTPIVSQAHPLLGVAPDDWGRPAAIHDFDGDGTPQWALSVGAKYLVMSLATDHAVIDRKWDVDDSTGIATGTAFDFLGDGTAEAIYADENDLWVFDSADDSLPALVQVPRSSRTLIEYPVVADVDNDGSAEIIVVSNESLDEVSTSPTVQVYGDADDRWIQARRIWNQHGYHVTNVREDGTIPVDEPPHWRSFNTWRTNAQIEGGAGCIPPAG